MMQHRQDRQRKALLEHYVALDKTDRHVLIQFAAFLRQQAEIKKPDTVTALPQEPQPISRPERESPVKALKRLRRTYPMIDNDTALLDAASTLLMEKVMGAEDRKVIDKMEALFKGRFEDWKKDQSTG